MLGGLQERRQVEKINALKLKEAEFDLAAKERAAQDQTDYQNVLREGWKLDAQGIPAYDDSGLPQFDDAAISQKFIKLGRPNLLTKFKQEQATLRQSAAEALAEEAKANEVIFQRYGDTLASFEAIPEDLRPDLWQSWLAAKAKSGMIDKDYASVLAQQPYSPELLEGEIQANIGQAESAKRHLAAAQIRKTKAEAAKAEQDLTAPTEKGYAPGTLIITKDAEGNEISRETVPARAENKGVEERQLDAWLAKNPGKDEADYLIYKANITKGAGGQLSPASEAIVLNRLTAQWDNTNKPIREMNRQIGLMNAGLAAADRGDLAQGAQTILVTFQKILDPLSVVRESEYMRSAAGQSLINRVTGAAEQLAKGGAGVRIGELKKFAQLAKEAMQGMESHSNQVRGRVKRTAEHYGIPVDLIFEDESPIESTPPPKAKPGFKIIP